jgi:hypothetical protein
MNLLLLKNPGKCHTSVEPRAERTPSRWREFSFAFHQLQQAVDPRIPLQSVINDWGEIAAELAEPPRKRHVQIEEMFGAVKSS